MRDRSRCFKNREYIDGLKEFRVNKISECVATCYDLALWYLYMKTDETLLLSRAGVIPLCRMGCWIRSVFLSAVSLLRQLFASVMHLDLAS